MEILHISFSFSADYERSDSYFYLIRKDDCYPNNMKFHWWHDLRFFPVHETTGWTATNEAFAWTKHVVAPLKNNGQISGTRDGCHITWNKYFKRTSCSVLKV